MIKIIRLILVIFAIFCFNPLFAYGQVLDPNKHYAYGKPEGTPVTNDLIVREIYALSSNDDTKFADWVAYRLDRDTVFGNANTSRNYKEDPAIDPSETLEPEDYDNAFDTIKTTRGHQAPLGTFKGTNLWQQTNFLSNITPQKGDLNGGVWLKLEEEVRDIVQQCDVTYVITGPLYERDMPKLPEADEPHVIPSGYWKIVALNVENQPEDLLVSAFIFDQDTPKNATIKSGQKTVDEIESRSGLNFFIDLADDIEDEIEQKKVFVFDATLGNNNKCQLNLAVEPEPEPNPPVSTANTLKISSLLPNPNGDETQLESATIKNIGDEEVDLTGWRLRDRAGKFWNLDSLGSLRPDENELILRRGQSMALNNGGDTVELLSPDNQVVDTVTYSNSSPDVIIFF